MLPSHRNFSPGMSDPVVANLACCLYLNANELKLNIISCLSHTSRISGAQEPQVAGDYCTGWPRFRDWSKWPQPTRLIPESTF